MVLANILTDLTDWLEDVSAEWWFLLVILGIAFFDSIIPIVPSETTVILGGVAAGAGDQNLLLVIAAGATGAFLGDNTAYLIGRRFAPWIQRRAERRPKTAKRLRWADDQIKQRGGLLLITARFIPGGRTALTLSSRHHPPAVALVRGVGRVAARDLGDVRRRARRDLRPDVRGQPHGRVPARVRRARCRSPIIIEVVRHVRGKRTEDAERTGARRRRPEREFRRRGAGTYPDRMLAVVPVRDGVLPAGADEVVAECGGRAILAGSAPDAERAGRDRHRRAPRRARRVRARTAGRGASPALVDDDVVVLPGVTRRARPRPAPGPRPRPAAARRRRRDRPGQGPARPRRRPRPPRRRRSTNRSSPRCSRACAASPGVAATRRPCPTVDVGAGDGGGHGRRRCVEVLPPDVTTMDLAEAPRIVGGGAGLDGASPLRPARRRRRGARRVDGRDPRHHRPRLGRPRAPDRHDRRRRRPRPVPRVRHQRRRPAHRRPRHARPRRQRQHRPALPDDADGRPRRRRRRQRRARRAGRAPRGAAERVR